MLFCCNTDVIQKFVSFNFYDLLLNANWEKIFSLCFCMHLYGLIIVYCMKGCVICLFCFFNELWVYVAHQILQQSTCLNHVLSYMCTKFGTNIVGEMCNNSVTWFCSYLCKTEDTMNNACCNIWCTTCSLFWPLSANISKSAEFLSFVFNKSFLALCTF